MRPKSAYPADKNSQSIALQGFSWIMANHVGDIYKTIVDKIDNDTKFRASLIIITSAIAGLLFTAIVFPYVETADSTLRWQFADWIQHHSSQSFPKFFIVSKFLALLMAAVEYFGGSRWVFTFIQATACFSCVHICVILASSKNIPPRKLFLLALLAGIFPTNSLFFLTPNDGAWVFIGLTCLFGAFKIDNRMFWPWKFCAIALSSAVLFAARPNSLGLLPAFALAMPFAQAWLRNWITAAGLAIGLVAGLILPGQIAPTPPANPVSLAMAWEVTGVAKVTGDPYLIRSLGKFGDAQSAIRLHNNSALNNIFWDKNPPLPANMIANPNNKDEIYDLYFFTIKNHTTDFFNIKLDLIAGVLGLGPPRLPPSYGFNLGNDKHIAAGGVSNRANKFLMAAFTATSNGPLFFASHPFIIMIFGLTFFFINFLKNQIAAFLSFFAVVYYMTFTAFCQSVEFRYFAPTYIVIFSIFFTFMLERWPTATAKIDRLPEP